MRPERSRRPETRPPVIAEAMIISRTYVCTSRHAHHACVGRGAVYQENMAAASIVRAQPRDVTARSIADKLSRLRSTNDGTCSGPGSTLPRETQTTGHHTRPTSLPTSPTPSNYSRALLRTHLFFICLKLCFKKHAVLDHRRTPRALGNSPNTTRYLTGRQLNRRCY